MHQQTFSATFCPAGRPALEPLEPRLLLDGTPYLVDSPGDVVAVDGVITLREAILAASTNAPAGDAAAGSAQEVDVIGFAESLHGGSIALSGSELLIEGGLQILGPGAEDLTVDAGDASRIFRVSAGAAVEIEGLSLCGGFADADGDGRFGGAIFSEGQLSLRHCRLWDNEAYWSGGAIYQQGSEAELELSACVLHGNRADWSGGAVYSNSGSVVMLHTTISGNAANDFGGGVYGFQASVQAVHATITANRANSDGAGTGSGGGLFTYQSPAMLHNSIVADNFGNEADLHDDIRGDIDATSSHNILGLVDGQAPTGGAGENILGVIGMTWLEPLDDPQDTMPHHRISETSPAVDAGDNSITVLFGDPVDQLGAPRIYDGNRDGVSAVDIGAVEYMVPGDANRDNAVDSVDLATVGLYWNPGGTGMTWQDGDFDFDGDVDGNDLARVALYWLPGGYAAAGGIAETTSPLIQTHTNQLDGDLAGVGSDKPEPAEFHSLLCTVVDRHVRLVSESSQQRPMGPSLPVGLRPALPVQTASPEGLAASPLDLDIIGDLFSPRR